MDKLKREYAPIVLTAYNRPWHFSRMILALSKNKEAIDSEVFVFLDGPRSPADDAAIDEIERIAEQKRESFARLELVRREANLGLAENTISAISQVLERSPKAIIMEDDSVVSNRFLAVMNDALDYYEDDGRVWHISAHTIVNDKRRPNDFFF